MIYHGSRFQNLTSLDFDKERSRAELTEGDGIYLTDSYKVAAEYAGSEGSVYKLEIFCPIFKAYERESFQNVLNEMENEYSIKFSSIAYVDSTIDTVVEGRSSIQNFGNSIKLILDNDEDFVRLSEKKGLDLSDQIAKNIRDKIHGYNAWAYYDEAIDQGKSLVYLVKNSSVIQIVDEKKQDLVAENKF